MTDVINAIGSTSAVSGSSPVSSANTKLTAETKSKLEALGVDTTNITTEAQGQIALLQAQQQQQIHHGHKAHSGNDKAEMETLKSEATSLAAKVGITVSSDEKVSDIVAAIGPVIEAKVAAAGNDQSKIAEAQELQGEYGLLSASLSNLEAQHSQAQASQAKLSSSMDGLANYNKASFKL